MDDDGYIFQNMVWKLAQEALTSSGSPVRTPMSSHVLQEGAGYDPPTGVEEGEEDEFEHEMEV